MGLVDTILKKLNNRSSSVRGWVAEDVSEHDKELRLAVARVGVTDTDSSIRGESAQTLAEIGTSLDQRRIRLLLQDEEWAVRSDAVFAIEKISGVKAQKQLLTMLSDRHYIVRRDAAVALAYLGKQNSIDPLEKALEAERTDQGKLGILQALILFGQVERLRDLVELHKSTEPGMDTATWSAVTEIVEEVPLRPTNLVFLIATLQELCAVALNPGVTSSINQVLEALRERYPDYPVPEQTPGGDTG